MSLINDAIKRANQAQPNRPTPPSRAPQPGLQPAAESQHGGSRALFFAAGALLVVFLGLGSWFLWNWASPKAKSISTTTTASTTPSPVPAAKPRAAGEAAPKVETMPVPPPVGAEVVSKPETKPIRVPRTSRSSLPPVAPKGDAVSPPPPVETKPAVAAPVPAPAVREIASSPAPATPAPKFEAPVTPAPPAVVSAAPVQATVAATPPPAPPAFPPLKLRGIFYRRTNPTALINGETVSDGDMVDEVKVVKIDRESVSVEWRGQQRVLRLP